ncbi:EamA family transporter [Sediminibacterium goheungense]|uniref:Drug/metabolite transporter (DMT)-like permease n=1 Tax=Sediminibacterium goheungense TaxID=1086393 RepID=A0A4R6IVG2_9BACT|nr:EamA family transporter [Sediminibacterium goheungense]TDO26643.1 drug/metabolite transporter (DMT)-like permease [Sediminibacterium goheungense]
MTTRQKAYIGLAATSIIWGTSWVASKIAVKGGVPGLEVAAIRQFMGGALFVSFFLIRGEKLPTGKQMLWLAGMGSLLFVIANGFATVALRYIPSGLAALIAALYPLSVVIIERLFFRNTKITWVTFTGLLLGISGIGIVFYDNAFHNQTEGYILGLILSLIAMLSWSVGTIIIARNKVKINAYNATGWQMLLASFLLMIMTLVSGDTVPLSAVPASTWMAIAYLVFVSSIVAFVAFIYTMKHLEPAIAALYAYINPIVAILTGSVLMNEKLTIDILIGSAITLAGVFLVNRSLKKQREQALADVG